VNVVVATVKQQTQTSHANNHNCETALWHRNITQK